MTSGILAASGLSWRKSCEQGFALYTLGNDWLSLSVAPQLGGKITNLSNRRTGREWLWAPDSARRLFTSIPGSDFLQSTLLGADECIPTIEACTVNGRDYPPQGEAWSRPWTIDQQAWNAKASLTGSVLLPLSQASFTRAITVDRHCVQLAYSATNASSVEPWHFTYNFHPLLAPQPGDSIIAPRGMRRVRVENWGGRAASWPRPHEHIHADQLSFGSYSPATLKMFSSEPLSEKKAAIRNVHTKEGLEFDFSGTFFTSLGIYINRGGWGGHHHVALEPSNARADSLRVCMDRDWGYRMLAPGETITWNLVLRLEGGESLPKRTHP